MKRIVLILAVVGVAVVGLRASGPSLIARARRTCGQMCARMAGHTAAQPATA
jgi:hypothetical protein